MQSARDAKLDAFERDRMPMRKPARPMLSPVPLDMPGMPYKASAALEAHILKAAPPHYASPKAPSTYAQLVDRFAIAQRTNAPLAVYDGGSANTIYSRPEVNYAFRAWHDATHVKLDADFSMEGEKRVAIDHFQQIGLAGLSAHDQAMLWADTWGQSLYADAHHGVFPLRQDWFVTACMVYGIDHAVAGSY